MVTQSGAGQERNTMTKIARSNDLYLVGYFLSRCGEVDPPNQLSQLGVDSWKSAYLLFLAKLEWRQDKGSLWALAKATAR